MLDTQRVTRNLWLLTFSPSIKAFRYEQNISKQQRSHESAMIHAQQRDCLKCVKLFTAFIPLQRKRSKVSQVAPRPGIINPFLRLQPHVCFSSPSCQTDLPLLPRCAISSLETRVPFLSTAEPFCTAECFLSVMSQVKCPFLTQALPDFSVSFLSVGLSMKYCYNTLNSFLAFSTVE